jgi:hypothetical protein
MACFSLRFFRGKILKFYNGLRLFSIKAKSKAIRRIGTQQQPQNPTKEGEVFRLSLEPQDPCQVLFKVH